MSDPDARTRTLGVDEAPPTPRRDRSRGDLIGRFVVIAKLGEGGMGAVYAAHDPTLNRRVAIKLLRRELSEAAYGGRMVREAQALAKLSHPNVVNVHDVGLADGRMFLAMEHIDGRALSDVLDDALPWTRVLELFLEAGQGLAAAHAAGLIHRDFKPQNAMLGNDGRVRVLDFGLARDSEERAAPQGGVSPPGELSSYVTHAGAVMGTPSYMSPEQFDGQPCDARTDQFSFCVSLWEGLYAALPFPAQVSPRDLPTRGASAPVAPPAAWGALQPPPRGGSVPARVHQALLKGLSLKPEDRFPSMDALLAVLKPRARRYPLSLVYALGALTALLSSGVVVDQVQRRTPRGWWSRNKASCNPVRVTAALRDARGQGGALSAGGPVADLYASTCLALAGQFVEADHLAAGLPPTERAEAARLFYRLGAPTEEAAAARIAPGQLPMMELALKHSPPGEEHHLRAAYYLALAELEEGKTDDARRHLEDFLKAHPGNDAWRRTALEALAGLR